MGMYHIRGEDSERVTLYQPVLKDSPSSNPFPSLLELRPPKLDKKHIVHACTVGNSLSLHPQYHAHVHMHELCSLIILRLYIIYSDDDSDTNQSDEDEEQQQFQRCV